MALDFQMINTTQEAPPAMALTGDFVVIDISSVENTVEHQISEIDNTLVDRNSEESEALNRNNNNGVLVPYVSNPHIEYAALQRQVLFDLGTLDIEPVNIQIAMDEQHINDLNRDEASVFPQSQIHNCIPRAIRSSRNVYPQHDTPSPPPPIRSRPPCRRADSRLGNSLTYITTSTIPGAGKGLFARRKILSNSFITTYTGTRLTLEERWRSTSYYVMQVQNVIIDAASDILCKGRYINDPLGEYPCNCRVRRMGDKLAIYSTHPIAPNTEIFIRYGRDFWTRLKHPDSLRPKIDECYPKGEDCNESESNETIQDSDTESDEDITPDQLQTKRQRLSPSRAMVTHSNMETVVMLTQSGERTKSTTLSHDSLITQPVDIFNDEHRNSIHVSSSTTQHSGSKIRNCKKYSPIELPVQLASPRISRPARFQRLRGLCHEPVFIASSTLPDAGQGLFASRYIPANTVITSYSGKRLKKCDVHNSKSLYIMEHNGLIIDAENSQLGHGGYINDPMGTYPYNCSILRIKDKLIVYSTTPVHAYTEYFIPYGVEYWTQQDHPIALKRQAREYYSKEKITAADTETLFASNKESTQQKDDNLGEPTTTSSLQPKVIDNDNYIAPDSEEDCQDLFYPFPDCVFTQSLQALHQAYRISTSECECVQTLKSLTAAYKNAQTAYLTYVQMLQSNIQMDGGSKALYHTILRGLRSMIKPQSLWLVQQARAIKGRIHNLRVQLSCQRKKLEEINSLPDVYSTQPLTSNRFAPLGEDLSHQGMELPSETHSFIALPNWRVTAHEDWSIVSRHQHKKRQNTSRILCCNVTLKETVPVQSSREDYPAAMLERVETTRMGIRGSGDIVVGTLNVNGLARHKVHDIVNLIKQNNIDVLVCVDTRLSCSQARHFKKIFISLLGEGSRCLCPTYHPVNGYTLRQGAKKGNRPEVGGQLVLLSPRWGGAFSKMRDDITELGVITGTELDTADGKILIIGTYWPVKSTWAQSKLAPFKYSLATKLQSWLDRHKSSLTPLEYIRRRTTEWVTMFSRQPGHQVILTGDFNGHWTPGKYMGEHKGLRNWAHMSGLDNGPAILQALCSETISTHGFPDRGTWLDHVLHTSNQGMRCTATGVVIDTLWTLVSDHRPIWAEYIIPGGRGDKGSLIGNSNKVDISNISRIELPLNNAKRCDSFARKIAIKTNRLPQVDNGLTAEECLYYISTQSTKITCKLNSRAKLRRYRHPADTREVIFQEYLRLLLNLRKHAVGSRRVRKLMTEEDKRRVIREYYKEWLDRMNLRVNQNDITDTLGFLEHEEEQWLMCQLQKLAKKLEHQIAEVKGCLQGRRRKEESMRISKAVHRREMAREYGKLGRVIDSVMGAHRPFLTLHALTDNSGHLRQDSDDIHTLLTDHFNKWMDHSTDWEIPPDTSEWYRYISDRDYFMTNLEHSNIPRDLLELIHTALQPSSNIEETRTMIVTAIQDPPTLEEFKTEIKHLRKNSSGGPTGLTYNMMKSWPEETLTKVHQCLSVLWSESHIPAFWKWRWLVPIPKSDDINIQHMRPLALIETTRKVWSKLLLDKINVIWRNQSSLNDAQHGFQKNRGTGTASLIHINNLEEAKYHRRHLHRTSWDISKAFDSVSHTAINLGWIRLGLPHFVVSYLATLDADGPTIVRTPKAIKLADDYSIYHLAQDSVAVEDYMGVANSPTLANHSFIAKRGTGQGDITSPACWSSIFDILLRALQIDGSNAYYSCDTNGSLSLQMETAYADDLESQSSDTFILQRKADIVSAFSIIFGLSISVTKLRRCTSTWSKIPITVPDLIIHSANWIPTPVKVTTTGESKYLGILYNLDGSSRAAIKLIRDKANKAVHLLRAIKGTPETKVAVAISHTIAQIGYIACCTSLRLKDYEEIDSIFSGMYRQATKNLKNFPTELLYAPVALGGMGIKRFSSKVHEDKLRLLQTGLHGTNRIKAAAMSLLQRASGHLGQDLTDGKAGHLYHVADAPTLWVTSLIEWLDKAGIHYKKSGPPRMTWDSCIQNVLSSHSATDREFLKTHYITDMVSLLSARGTKPTWNPPLKLSTQLRYEITSMIPPSDHQPTRLQYGQFWRMRHRTIEAIWNLGDAIEIHGWKSAPHNSINISVWKKSPTLYSGKLLSFTCSTQRLGMGSNLWLPYDKIFPTWLSEQLILDHSTNRYTSRVLIHNNLTRSPTIPHTMYSQDSIHTLVHACLPTVLPEHLHVHTAYTMHKGYSSQAVFDPTTPSTSTITHAITITGEGITPIILRSTSVFPDQHLKHITVGLAVTAVAMDLARTLPVNTTINLPNRQLVKMVKNAAAKKPIGHHHAILSDIIMSSVEHITDDPLAYLPVNKTDRSSSTLPSYSTTYSDGRFLVDAMTRGEPRFFLYAPDSYHLIDLTLVDLLDDIDEAEWQLCNTDNVSLHTVNCVSQVQYAQWKRYLTVRDENRVGHQKWVDNTLGFAAIAFDCHRPSLNRRAQAQRLMYDKGCHGGNRAKWTSIDSAEDSSRLSACHRCNGLDGERHWITECPHPTSLDIRRKCISNLNNLKLEMENKNNQLGVKVGDNVLRNITNSDTPERLWIGNFNLKLRDSLLLNLESKAQKSPGLIRSLFLQYQKIMCQTTRELWAQHTTKIPRGCPWRTAKADRSSTVITMNSTTPVTVEKTMDNNHIPTTEDTVFSTWESESPDGTLTLLMSIQGTEQELKSKLQILQTVQSVEELDTVVITGINYDILFKIPPEAKLTIKDNGFSCYSTLHALWCKNQLDPNSGLRNMQETINLTSNVDRINIKTLLHNLLNSQPHLSPEILQSTLCTIHWLETSQYWNRMPEFDCNNQSRILTPLEIVKLLNLGDRITVWEELTCKNKYGHAILLHIGSNTDNPTISTLQDITSIFRHRNGFCTNGSHYFPLPMGRSICHQFHLCKEELLRRIQTGKNTSDKEADEHISNTNSRLDQTLLEANRDRIPTVRDGNSFFRAITLSGLDEDHDWQPTDYWDLRNMVHCWMQDRTREQGLQDMGLDYIMQPDYLSKWELESKLISIDGQPSDSFTVMVLSNAIGIAIKIFSDDGQTIWVTPNNKEDTPLVVIGWDTSCAYYMGTKRRLTVENLDCCTNTKQLFSIFDNDIKVIENPVIHTSRQQYLGTPRHHPMGPAPMPTNRTNTAPLRQGIKNRRVPDSQRKRSYFGRLEDRDAAAALASQRLNEKHYKRSQILAKNAGGHRKIEEFFVRNKKVDISSDELETSVSNRIDRSGIG